MQLPLLILLLCAHPHKAPTVFGDIVVRGNEVECKVTGLREIVDTWTEATFHEANPIAVDGMVVPPVLRRKGEPSGLEPDDMEEFVELTFVYACDRPPRSVAIRWTAFDGAIWQGENVVPLMVHAGRDVQVRGVSPEEPEFIWHAPPAVPVVRPKPVGKPAEQHDINYFAVLAFGLLAVVGIGVAGPKPEAGLALVMIGVVGALLALQPRARPFAFPTEAQARTIFETLHRNIYDAFDAANEDEIYALLAVSVAEHKLDALYGDVYESLILREQGGAVCRIEEVELVEGHVDLPRPEEDERRYFVDWTWRVHCAVTHWGHTHRRLNEYAAKYTVAHDGASWKIDHVDVQDQKRIDLD